MSRRSLRLENSLLDRNLPHSSTSFSAGGARWRSGRTLRSRGSQPLSTSCSESLLLPQTPRKSSSLAPLDSSRHSVASDASLISSLVDESTLHESTLVDTLWGLDNDSNIQESAAPEEESSAAVNPRPSRLHCTNCETSLSSCVSSSMQPESRESATSTVYRGGRRNRTRQNVLMVVGRIAAHCFGLLLHIWRLLLRSQVTQEDGRAARPAAPGVMSLTEAPAETRAAQPNASLCKVLADLLGRPCRWFSRSCTSCSTLTRSLLGLLLLFVLLILSVSWFSLPTLQSVLLSDWTAALTGGHRPESSKSQSGESAMRPHEESPHLEAGETDDDDDHKKVVTSALFSFLKLRGKVLWEPVEARGRQEERRHSEALRLYDALRQQQDGVAVWLKQHLDQQLSQIREQLDEDRQQWEQWQQTELLQQHARTTRLDRLELQLKKLNAKTRVGERGRTPTQVQVKQEVAASTYELTSTLPAAVSVAVDHQSHEALMAEISRLEAALQDVRRDMESLSGCGNECQQLADVQQEISGQVAVQVREELRALVSGAGGGSAVLSESLLQWLSQHYVSTADLQEALSSLQRSIQHNISLQLEQLEQQHSDDSSPEPAGGAVTTKDVGQMVTDALRLFSQDRTGMADYALESGGGSILSTRCSETYQSKAAVLSLFGVPLWYFSQSPRAVIQPDVNPGNCWAFKGSSGFLLIRLSMRIRPTAFSLEHIPRVLAPNLQLLSAPRDFSIYGLDHEDKEKGTLLGTYTYDQDGEALQTFAVTEDTDQTFQIVEVQILSNWGHPDYTCLYRLRVHGTPATV